MIHNFDFWIFKQVNWNYQIFQIHVQVLIFITRIYHIQKQMYVIHINGTKSIFHNHWKHQLTFLYIAKPCYISSSCSNHNIISFDGHKWRYNQIFRCVIYFLKYSKTMFHTIKLIKIAKYRKMVKNDDTTKYLEL